MAALCHDVGHLPFSHAAEKELLPDGYDHERLTKEIIQSDEMVQIWDDMSPPIWWLMTSLSWPLVQKKLTRWCSTLGRAFLLRL